MSWLRRADERNQRRMEQITEASTGPAPPPTAFDRAFDAWVTVRVALLTLALYAGLVALVVAGAVWVVRQV